MAAAPPLRDRLGFLHRLPILLKGTSDDDIPCPGYLFEEIAKISHESLGSSQCLLEYLLNRLDSSSGHVKLKVLKILLYLCGHGSSSFLLILKRNSAFIQEATVFAGPPDPLHGNSLYQKVRAAAQDLGSTLFSDALLPSSPSQPPRAPPPAGMGSQARPHSALQGFGYSKEQGRAGSAGEAFLATVQRAAEAVAKAVRPGPELAAAQRPSPRSDAYQPAVTPPASHSHPTIRNLLPGARAVRHQPGQAGGGWEELDSSPSSQNSSHTSDLSSRCGSDSLSAAGREPGGLAERTEAMTLSDYQQELSLVRAMVPGPRAFLSREETQHFIRECGLLNCEAVLELLLCQLGQASEGEQMRALCAVASLANADLLPQERVLLLCQQRLQELSAGSPGPVTSKATKILRHLEASCGHRVPWPPAPEPLAKPRLSAATQGLPDLLTDPVPPPGGQVFLQLLGPVPTPPPDACLLPVPRVPSETDLGPGDAGTAKATPDRRALSQGSLFAGMELVARPRLVGSGAAMEEPCQAPNSPQTASPGEAAPEHPGPAPSAFAFLNV